MKQILVFFFLHFGFVLGPVLGSDLGLEWAKMTPMRTSRALKYQETSFSKSEILQLEKYTFRVLEALKRSMRGSRRLPRGTWRASKLQKKGFEKWNQKNSFWTNFGTEMNSKIEHQKTENWTKNGTEIGTASGEQKWGGKCKYCKLQVQVQVQIMSDK